jgi:outer membrane usher protein
MGPALIRVATPPIHEDKPLNANRILFAAITTVLVGTTSGAFAATDGTSFNVKIIVTNTCDIHTVAATDVDFGSVASTAVNTDATGQLNVTCTPLAAYTIALGNGQNGASVSTRKMKDGGANLIPYQLYKAAARGPGDVWGSTVGTDVYSGTGTGAAQAIPVYGRVPAANVPAGAYNDVVTATITY